MVNDDWSPIGPQVRREMLAAGLTEESRVAVGLTGDNAPEALLLAARPGPR